MKSQVIFILVILILSVSVGFAQQWSAEQKEVWKALEEQSAAWTSGDMDAAEKFLHPDFVFWNNRNAIPGDRATAMALDRAWFGSGARFEVSVHTPLTILVYDDIAVLNFYARGYLAQPGEQPRWSTAQLSNVWKKENGRWLLLSVHGYLE